MLNSNQIKKLFTADGHLSEEGIALWADALQYKKTDALPKKLREHVESCVVCKSSVINTFSVLQQNDQPLSEHPYFGTKNNETKRFGKHRINTWAKIAASVLILLSIMVVLLFLLQENKNKGGLFAEYFSPYPDIITQRNGTQVDQSKTFVEAMNYYDKEEYGKAFRLFAELNKNETPSDTVLFYYGNSSLASGDVKQAVVLFEQLLADTNSRFRMQSEWYIALACLSLNKPEECLRHLKKVIEEDPHQKEKALDLYNTIK